jgi:hypothetical protein
MKVYEEGIADAGKSMYRYSSILMKWLSLRDIQHRVRTSDTKSEDRLKWESEFDPLEEDE